MSSYADQRAHRRIDRLEAELVDQRRLVTLLATALGVDLERLATLERLRRRGGYPVTWQDLEALGRDPDDGTAA